MIRNLRDTTQKNSEQDWLKTNLANFTRLLQGQRDLMAVGKMVLSELAPVVSAQQGVFYIVQNPVADGKSVAAPGSESDARIKLLASYAFRERRHVSNEFRPGEGLVGQAVLEKQRILLTDVPGDYVTRITSGLGEAPPTNIIVLPVVFEGQVKAVIELSSFQRFSQTHQAFLDQLTESVGIVLNTIEANSLTEDLLKQSQTLTNELQSRQQQLQNSNLELEQKARQLVEQNAEVERKNNEVENKNREVEQARRALEEKASQLALTSKYKSEFLANMSHELRTPLNSLLILADQLASNSDGNLTGATGRVFQDDPRLAARICSISSTTFSTSPRSRAAPSRWTCAPCRCAKCAKRWNGPSATSPRTRESASTLNWLPALPSAIQTDSQRLDQVLKNLFSNAFKFTERGRVALRIAPATGGWSPDNQSRSTRRPLPAGVLAFALPTPGIGIAPEKQSLIFEAFQQADGSTSRKYGGTGLGLAISREIARLLGGELTLTSVVGQGSTFTLFVPCNPVSAPRAFARRPPAAAALRPRTAPRRPASRLRLPRRFPRNQGVSFPPISAWPRQSAMTGGISSPATVSLLIIEDDQNFAPFLREIGHEHGFKCLVAARGYDAMTLAQEYAPAAITLDLSLPDLDGWRVLERLKSDLATRHIPVSIISVSDEPERGLKLGSLAFVTKPASRDELVATIGRLKRFVAKPVKQLLLVEDDETQRLAVKELIGNGTVQMTAIGERRGGAGAARATGVRLPGRRSAAARGIVGRPVRRNAQGATPLPRPAHPDLYRQGTLARGGKTTQPTGARRHLQGRAFARTALRPDRPVAAPSTLELLPETQQKILRTLHHPDAVLGGKESATRGRRHPQHLRDDFHAGALPHGNRPG